MDDVRRTASWLSDAFKTEPDVGLTAIHIASIERQLAHLAEADAPQPEPIPLRRNWGLWGSVAASTLIVATVMASILPQIFKENRLQPAGGGGAGAGNGGDVSTPATPGILNGLMMSNAPSATGGKVAALRWHRRQRLADPEDVGRRHALAGDHLAADRVL